MTSHCIISPISLSKEEIFKRERGLLPSTQHLVRPTQHIKEIDSTIKDIYAQISSLQTSIHTLKTNKYEYEKRLVHYDKTVYISPCPYYNCRGYINESYQCGICQLQACGSCKGELHNGPCDGVSVTLCSTCCFVYCICNVNKCIKNTTHPIWLNSNEPAIKERSSVFLNLRERIFPRLEEETDTTHQDLRIEYLMNNMTEDEFYTKLKARYARMKKHTEYKRIISWYIQSVSELALDKFVENEMEICEKANMAILDLNQTHRCTFSLVPI